MQSACPFCYTDVKAGFHIDDTSRRWKPIISAASKVSSAFVGGTGRHIQKYLTLPKLNPSSSYYYKDNFGGWVTYTYAIQPSSTSSTLWRTATRTEWDQLSWPTKPALLWPHQVRAQEMQHSWISARGTRRRQGSVEFDMCHQPEESRSRSWTSSCPHPLWPYKRQLHQCNVIVENDGLYYKQSKCTGLLAIW